MKVDPANLVSAGDILPGDRVFIVMFCGNHPTLKLGDEVRIAETQLPDLRNMFIRQRDWTVHSMMLEPDSNGYVIVCSADKVIND